MRCTCGKPGTITLKRRDFPYCQECFRHAVVRLFRLEAGEGPVHLKPSSATADPWDAFYRGAITAIAQDARREVIEDEAGAIPGCAEYAAAKAIEFLMGRTKTLTNVFPSSVTREELERFFKPAPKEVGDVIEQDLERLEERYPGTLASVLRSAHDRVKEKQ